MLQGKDKPISTLDKTQIDARRSTGFDGAVLRELQSDDRAVDRDLAKRRGASLDREVVGLEFAKHRVVERRRS